MTSYCLPSDTCMTNGDREGRIFLSHPNTNIMAFLAHPEIKKAPEYDGIYHNDVTLTCG